MQSIHNHEQPIMAKSNDTMKSDLISNTSVKSESLPIMHTYSNILGRQLPYVQTSVNTLSPASQPNSVDQATVDALNIRLDDTISINSNNQFKSSTGRKKRTAVDSPASRLQKHNQAEIRRRARINALSSELAISVGCTDSNRAHVLSTAIQQLHELKSRVAYYESQIINDITPITLAPNNNTQQQVTTQSREQHNIVPSNNIATTPTPTQPSSSSSSTSSIRVQPPNQIISSSPTFDRDLLSKLANHRAESIPIMIDIANKLQSKQQLSHNEQKLLNFLIKSPVDQSNSYQTAQQNTSHSLPINPSHSLPSTTTTSNNNATQSSYSPQQRTQLPPINDIDVNALQKTTKRKAHSQALSTDTVTISYQSTNDYCSCINHSWLYHNFSIASDIVRFDGVIIDCNERFAEFFGFTRDTMIRRNIFDLTHPESMDVTFQHRQKLFDCEIAVTNKTFTVASGRVRAARVISWVTLDSSNNPAVINTLLEPLSA